MHTTDAVDLVYVISGAGDLLLDDGAHPIAAGDCVVMAGVPHGMRAGADGCRVLATSLGTPSID
jgi:quercetin dioxygenase-like cupin family protein